MLCISYTTKLKHPEKVQPDQMMTELWHQRLGHLGPSQLSSDIAYGSGMPPKLSTQFHPAH